MYILSDLWIDCFSSDTRSPKRGSEYWGLAQSMKQKREQIMSELSEEGRRAFEAFERAHNTLSDIKEEDTCIRSFRLGAKLMMDILGNYNSPFDN